MVRIQNEGTAKHPLIENCILILICKVICTDSISCMQTVVTDLKYRESTLIKQK